MAESRGVTLVVINSQLLQAGLSATHKFSVEGGSIGGSVEADWQLQDDKNSVHSLHCNIFFTDTFFCLNDNCGITYINDASMPIGRNKVVKLNEKDVLNIGVYQIRVHFDDKYTDEKILDLDGDDTLDIEIHSHKLLFQNETKNETKNNDDPLKALDSFERKLSSKFSGAESKQIKEKMEQDNVDYLLAKDHGKQGASIIVQADCERDESAAIYLKTESKEKVKNIKTERLAIETPLNCKTKGIFRSKLLSSYRQLMGSELLHTTNSNMAQKDSAMNDKVLDLLEDDIDSDFNLYESALDSGVNHLVAAPLLRGLGVQTGDLNNLGEMQILSEEIGASLQAAIKGLLELHSQVENSRYGVMNKNLQPIEDNPLRLGLSYEETVQTMFDVHRSLVHLSAPSSIAESLQTVKHHNESVQIATSDALNQILRAFSPEVLTRRFNRYKRAGVRINESEDAWAWKMYQSYYSELTSNRQNGFEKLFWEIFDQAYDKTLREKQQEE